MLEVDGIFRRPILRLVKDRSRKTLLSQIQQHIRPRTSILTDEWHAYKRPLSQYGYHHYSVCHKIHFIDPGTGAHTQYIELAWQNYKLEIWRQRGNRTPESLKTHLKMIEWHHWLGVHHYDGVLGRLIHDVKKQDLQDAVIKCFCSDMDQTLHGLPNHCTVFISFCMNRSSNAIKYHFIHFNCYYYYWMIYFISLTPVHLFYNI